MDCALGMDGEGFAAEAEAEAEGEGEELEGADGLDDRILASSGARTLNLELGLFVAASPGVGFGGGILLVACTGRGRARCVVQWVQLVRFGALRTGVRSWDTTSVEKMNIN